MQHFQLSNFKAPILLVVLLIASLSWSPLAAQAQNNSKKADIQQLMDVMYGDKLIETIIMTMAEALQLDAGPMKTEVIDSLRVLLLENSGVLRDSIAHVYDRMYSAQEIKDMIAVYRSPIGQRIIETQNELFQQSMAIGRAWGQSQEEEIKKRLKPVFDKHRGFDESETASTDDPFAVDPLLPVVQSHNSNKRLASGSKPFKYSIKYNDQAWKTIPAKDINELADLAFTHNKHEILALVIAEKTKIDLQNLRASALVNMHKVATGVKIRKSATRQVNGKEVLVLIADCRIDDQRISYYNYYYSGDWGVLQFIVFSDQETMKKQQAQVEALLSGLMAE